MNSLRALYNRLLNIIRARSQAGGLEISDTALRYAFLKRGVWQFEEVPLATGALVRGVPQDEGAFIAALHALHARITGGKRRRVGVVVSLSSTPLYSQVFTLPKIPEAEMEKAVTLNIQMNSPLALTESSSGWQELQVTGTNVEVLTASVPITLASAIRRGLVTAGFLPVVLEARSFSIARFVRSAVTGFDSTQPYLVVLVDDAGLAVLILKYGFVYFEYNSFWSDIQGDAQAISPELFNEALARQVGQVVNFHRQHSDAAFKEALIVAPSFQDQIATTLTERFGLVAHPVQVGDPPFPLPWFVAAGAGLRGALSRADDAELNLIGLGAQSAFQEDQIVTYLQFWRILVPAALALLLVTALAGYSFVRRTSSALEARVAQVRPGAQVQELAALEAEATQFNESIIALSQAQAQLNPKSPIAADVAAVARTTNIGLARLYLVPSPATSIVTGLGPSEEAVLAFKKALQNDKRLTDVTLPITNIRTTPQGISFSMTFRSDFSASAKTP